MTWAATQLTDDRFLQTREALKQFMLNYGSQSDADRSHLLLLLFID